MNKFKKFIKDRKKDLKIRDSFNLKFLIICGLLSFIGARFFSLIFSIAFTFLIGGTNKYLDIYFTFINLLFLGSLYFFTMPKLIKDFQNQKEDIKSDGFTT